MKCQEIKLENGDDVIIDHNTRKLCEKCNKQISFATRKGMIIKVELVGLAQWNVHECK